MEAAAPTPTLLQRLYAPVDIGLIVVFRVAFGACMVIEVGRYFAKSWIDRQFISPAFHFRYYGFEWVHVAPGNGMYVVFTLLGISAALMAIGFLYRIAATVFAVLFTWVFLIDQTWYLNHFYLISLLGWISILLPANRAWSVDAWLRPGIRSQTVPAWTLWLLRFQIAVPYVFGGIAKMQADWLSGVPMRIMMKDGAQYPILGQQFDNETVILAFAWGGMFFDLLIVPALLWGPTRIPAYFAAVLFHASNARMFQIGIFPLVMVAASMIFFPPEWLAPEPKDGAAAPKKTEPTVLPPVTGRQKLFMAFLGVYLLWQCLMPFRHWLYPGDVNWTEEGHRFSWHMKLRVKTGTTTFRATDANGQELTTFTKPKDLLIQRQVDLLGERPDFVLQYAHLIAKELSDRGHPDAKVYADSNVVLNGRKSQPMIDPEVDLSKVPRTLGHNTWIVPLYEPRPTLSELIATRAARAQRRQQEQNEQLQRAASPAGGSEPPSEENE